MLPRVALLIDTSSNDKQFMIGNKDLWLDRPILGENPAYTSASIIIFPFSSRKPLFRTSFILNAVLKYGVYVVSLPAFDPKMDSASFHTHMSPAIG
jgi:hypothetical protein